MKKILLTIAFTIILSINGFAQYKPFQFGLKIEPSLGWAKHNSESLIDNKTKMNFSWGFVGNFYFVENYGLSTGFNVRFMNNEFKFSTMKNDVIVRTIKNQYLEIPLGLTMRTEKIGDLRILGNISYGLGFLMNSEEKIYNVMNEQEIVMATEYSKMRHALIVKLGIEYYIHKSSCITTALVFNNNFVNISKDEQHRLLLNNLCLEIGFMF